MLFINTVILGPEVCRIFAFTVGQHLDVKFPPTRPRQPVGPNRLLIAFYGLAAGLLLGFYRLWRSGGLNTTPQPTPNGLPMPGPSGLGSALQRISHRLNWRSAT